MKAIEILRRYEVGERDFQRVNLRGQCFKGQDLSGVDFSGADIRGTNFSDANLRGAKFCGAKCGLQRRWAIPLTIVSWLLAGISSICLFPIILDFYGSDIEYIHTWIIPIALIAFSFFISCRGLRKSLKLAGVAGAAGVVVILVLLLVSVVVPPGMWGAFPDLSFLAFVASWLPINFAFIQVGLVGVAVGVASAGAVLAEVAAGVATGVAILAATGVALAATEFTKQYPFEESLMAVKVTAGVAIGVVVVAAGVYISWGAFRGDKRDAWLHSCVINFAAIGGTSFHSANLTDANFASARLKSTDLRKANITRVRWYGVQMLDRVRSGETYLGEMTL